MKNFHDLREGRILPEQLRTPAQGWSAEVIQQFKHKNAQPIMTVCGDPFDAPEPARNWVEELHNSLVTTAVPLSCLTGRIARGYVIMPSGSRNFHINPDGLLEAWTYTLYEGRLVWTRVDPASLAKASTSVTGSAFRT